MRIISKQNDYYDSIQAYGDDDSCVYVRKVEDVEVKSHEYSFISDLVRYSDIGYDYNYYVKPKIIMYCGKLYPFVVYKHKDDDTEHMITEFSEMDEISGYLKSFSKKHAEHWYEYLQRELWYTKRTVKLDFENFFKIGETIQVTKIFFDLNVPILSMDLKQLLNHRVEIKENRTFSLKLTINPNLKKYQFYKFKSSFEAYTDIRNFISQQLGGNSPKLVEIKNDDMIVKKGFDIKKSFRKEKQKIR